MKEFSSPEPQTSPHLSWISESHSFEEQSQTSSLSKGKHTSTDPTSTMIEKTTLSPVTSTSQGQNVSSLDFLAALVTSIHETNSNGQDTSATSGSNSIQSLDTIGLSTPGSSYNMKTFQTSHISPKNPATRVETDSPAMHPQGTVLVNSVPSRITEIMISQSNWDTISPSMPLSSPVHAETQKAFPITSIEQETTRSEDTDLMKKHSSGLLTVSTSTYPGISRTEANSTDTTSTSNSVSFAKTTDTSVGNASSSSTLFFPRTDISQVVNVEESSNITTLLNTSDPITYSGALSTVTQTFLHSDSISHPSSSELLSWTDSPLHEATSSVNSIETIHTSSFPVTSPSEGQGLFFPSSEETTTEELDTNLAFFKTSFPSWSNSELAISKDTRTSQKSYNSTKTEVSPVNITTSEPPAQYTVSPETLSADSTASSLLIIPTKISASASPLLPQRSNSTSFPKTSFPTSELFKTTDILDRSLETGISLPPNLRSTSLEILGLSEVVTDTEKHHSSSSFTVTNVNTITVGHELSSSVSTLSESSRDADTSGTPPSVWVTTILTSLPNHLETTRSNTDSFSHLTSGLRDTSISLQTNKPSPLESTLHLPSSETDVATAVNIPTPYQSPSPKFTDIPIATATILNPSSSIVESTGATSFPEYDFTMLSRENIHVPRTDILPSAETTLIDTTATLSPRGMTFFATTSNPTGISAVTSESSHSMIQSSHLFATIVKKPPSSISTPLPYPISTTTDTAASSSLQRITTPSGNLQTEDKSVVMMNGSSHYSMFIFTISKPSSQPIETSLSLLRNIMAESADLGRVTSAFQVVHIQPG
jgi:hypothetical protein